MNILARCLLGNRWFDWAERRHGGSRSCPIAIHNRRRATNVRFCHAFDTFDRSCSGLFSNPRLTREIYSTLPSATCLSRGLRPFAVTVRPAIAVTTGIWDRTRTALATQLQVLHERRQDLHFAKPDSTHVRIAVCNDGLSSLARYAHWQHAAGCRRRTRKPAGTAHTECSVHSKAPLRPES